MPEYFDSSRRRTIRNGAVLALILISLSAFDRFLAASETRSRQNSAAEAFRSGSALLARADPARAVEQLRKAAALDRGNPQYALSLGNALAELGKYAEAERLIDGALDHVPNDGEANLSAARLHAREGDPTDAESYYHRAIYGNWRSRPAERRAEVRLELVELLRRQHQQRRMLAELISLEAEGGGRELQGRLARLYMDAGSPQRAAGIWREITQTHADDAEAWRGLGEADLSLGLYRDARNAHRRAVALKPDAAGDARIALLDRLISLDPTPRSLASSEKYRRSIHILGWIRDDIQQIAAAPPPAEANEIAELMRQALAVTARREPAHVTNEAAEDILALAQRLWRARIRAFGVPLDAAHEPLRIIMERLAG